MSTRDLEIRNKFDSDGQIHVESPCWMLNRWIQVWIEIQHGRQDLEIILAISMRYLVVIMIIMMRLNARLCTCVRFAQMNRRSPWRNSCSAFVTLGIRTRICIYFVLQFKPGVKTCSLKSSRYPPCWSYDRIIKSHHSGRRLSRLLFHCLGYTR